MDVLASAVSRGREPRAAEGSRTRVGCTASAPTARSARRGSYTDLAVPRGFMTTHRDQFNGDLPAFIDS
jgi:hypothetical protein